jgi:hypothetical protein
MTDCRRSAFAGAARYWIVVPIVAAWLSATGCGESGAVGPPGEGLLAIESVATWYQQYRVKNGGKAPPDEEAFVSFVEGEKKIRGETLDRDKFLTSPRDKQKFVIVYGKVISANGENVAAYEKEGYGGKKLIGVESGAFVRGREIDDAQLQKLVAGK